MSAKYTSPPPWIIECVTFVHDMCIQEKMLSRWAGSKVHYIHDLKAV